MMLFRVPVGKMFYQGAPRLLSAGASVEPCRPTGDDRVAVEVYPAVVARRFIARASYKNDERRKQTPVQRAARKELVGGLRSEVLRREYGFTVVMEESWERVFVDDVSTDALDSLLCAVQAAWAYTKRDENYGVPEECDPNEGWILDPYLLEQPGGQPL